VRTLRTDPSPEAAEFDQLELYRRELTGYSAPCEQLGLLVLELGLGERPPVA
jgi:hypothetical protein